MKLRLHTIVGGRYFKSGEDVPDELVSPSIAKYAVTVSGAPATEAPKPPRPTGKRQFKARKRSKR